MCKVKMFGVWLRVDASATYEKLARALAAIGKRTIAEAVCTERGTEATALDTCIIGASLSEPHTSRTAFCMHVCLFVCGY